MKQKNVADCFVCATFWVFILIYLFGNGINGNLFIVSARSFESDDAVGQCKQRIVLTDSYVLTGMNFSASLSDENAARKYGLTVGTLYAEALRLAVSAVVGRTGTFLMSE